MHRVTRYQYYLTPKGWISGSEEVEGNRLDREVPGDIVAIYEFCEGGTGLGGYDETSWRCVHSDGTDHEALLHTHGRYPKSLEHKRQQH